MAKQKVGNVLNELVPETGERISYLKVDDFSGETDGVIYIDYQSEVYKRVFTGLPDVRWWSSIPAAIASAEQFNLTLGFYDDTFSISEDTEFTHPIAFFNGAKIASSKNFRFKGIIAVLVYCLDISGNIIIEQNEKIFPQWFGAMGNARASGGGVTSASNQFTLTSTNRFGIGDVVYVDGAGVAGAMLSTSITNIVGSVLTLANNASTTVTNAGISTSNDITALQRFFASARSASNTDDIAADTPSSYGCSKLYVPRGVYVGFGTANVYNGSILQGEFANVQGGAILMQGRISVPLINVVADNFDLDGVSINGGNGNNIFQDIVFKSSHIADANENAPVVKFQNAWNNHSDSQFNHCVWQNTAGPAVGLGFATTGSGAASQAVLTLADGSTFRSNGTSIGGSRVIIVGAGAAGANLSTYIMSGGGTNTVTLATNILTTVSNAVVYPQEDTVNPLRFVDCEFDVCRSGIEMTNNVSAQIIINNLQAFQCVRRVILKTSRRACDVIWNTGYMNLCGNYNDGTANRRNSIYYINAEGRDESKVIINNVSGTRDSTFGGAMNIRNAGLVNFNGVILDNFDSVTEAKFIYLVDIDYIKIIGCTLISDTLGSYTDARLISIVNSASYTDVIILANILKNTSVSTIQNFIQSDYLLTPATILQNTFSGLATVNMNSNISGNNVRNNCQSLSRVKKYGTAAPVSGAWIVGDTIEYETPIAGGYEGVKCVTAGIPGTWKEYGAILA